MTSDLSNISLTDGISNFRKATERWNDRLDLLAAAHDATVIDIFDLFEQLAADPNDFSLLGSAGAGGDADGDADGADFLVWQTQFMGDFQVGFRQVPEPAAATLAVVLLTVYFALHREKLESFSFSPPAGLYWWPTA